MATVTVTRRRGRYYSKFSALPGREFGPYSLDEIIRDLQVSAFLPAAAARDLVFDAAVTNSATTETE